MEPNANSMQPHLPRRGFRDGVIIALVHRRWFIRLRWLMAILAVLLLGVERVQFPEFRRPFEVALAICALAMVNVIWTAMTRGLHRDTEQDLQRIPGGTLQRVVLFVNAQMIVDLLILTIILRYSGGVESPMVVFYLFHMLIAALLLERAYAILQGFWAMGLCSVLGFGECYGWISPHYPFLMTTVESTLHTEVSYVLARVGVLGTAIFGTLFFTRQISTRLDRQERELNDANIALQTSRDAIEDLQARRSRFMQTAAHQLKTPLATIETLAGLIRDQVVGADGVPKTVGRIICRCQEAMVQVSELLTLARVQQAGRTRGRVGPSEVKPSIDRVALQYDQQAKGKGLKLEVVSDCAAALVALDERDFEDCIGNLLENAVKYTPKDGNIRLSATCDGEAVRISVSDTGMGIAEESVDDIFDPFRRGQLALAANIPGSGLGLAIVREVVEQAHGRIEVHSKVGKGSEFILWIPLYNARSSGGAILGTRSTVIQVCRDNVGD